MTSSSSGSDPSLPRDDVLEVLALFHFVIGALAAMVASIPLLALALPRLETWAVGGEPAISVAPRAALAGVYLAVGVAGLLYAVALVLAGRSLGGRRRLAFCRAVARLSLVFVPIGTVLGWATLRALARPEVAAVFARRREPRD